MVEGHFKTQNKVEWSCIATLKKLGAIDPYSETPTNAATPD